MLKFYGRRINKTLIPQLPVPLPGEDRRQKNGPEGEDLRALVVRGGRVAAAVLGTVAADATRQAA